jgi:hypothetical protein
LNIDSFELPVLDSKCDQNIGHELCYLEIILQIFLWIYDKVDSFELKNVDASQKPYLAHRKQTMNFLCKDGKNLWHQHCFPSQDAHMLRK